MDRRESRTFEFLIIAFALYHMGAFLIPFEKTLSYWLAYVFSVGALICYAAVIKAAYSRKYEAKSRFLGVSVVHVSGVYLALQLMAGFGVMSFSLRVSGRDALMTFGGILAVYIFCVITRQGPPREKTPVIKKLCREVSGLTDRTIEGDIRIRLQILADNLRSEAEHTGPEFEETDRIMAERVFQLKQAVLSGERRRMSESMKRAELQFAERLRLAKELKNSEITERENGKVL